MPFTMILYNALWSGYSQVFQWRIGLRFKNLCAGSIEFQTGGTDEFRHLPCIVHTIVLIHTLISRYQATFSECLYNITGMSLYVTAHYSISVYFLYFLHISVYVTAQCQRFMAVNRLSLRA